MGNRYEEKQKQKIMAYFDKFGRTKTKEKFGVSLASVYLWKKKAKTNKIKRQPNANKKAKTYAK